MQRTNPIRSEGLSRKIPDSTNWFIGHPGKRWLDKPAFDRPLDIFESTNSDRRFQVKNPGMPASFRTHPRSAIGYPPGMSTLSTTLCGVTLRNPIVAAAGTVGYGPEIDEVFSASKLGAITIKSITPENRDGNPPWRVCDLPAGMLNAIGLANPGLDRFMREILPELQALDTVIIGSIAGHSIQDYVEVATAFGSAEAERLQLIELNVSCPNTSTGRQFGDDCGLLTELVSAVTEALGPKPCLVKLSPGNGDMTELCDAVVAAGASGLTLINTIPAMAVDPETRRSRIGRRIGGLSGLAVHPIAVRAVHDAHLHRTAFGRPIDLLGLGGVASWRDVVEFMLVGANAVGVGTGFFFDPRVVDRLLRDLVRWLARQPESEISSVIGGLLD